MENQDVINPLKRPRVRDSVDGLLMEITEKDKAYDALNSKFKKLSDDYAILQKNFERLMGKFEAQFSAENTSEDDACTLGKMQKAKKMRKGKNRNQARAKTGLDKEGEIQNMKGLEEADDKSVNSASNMNEGESMYASDDAPESNLNHAELSGNTMSKSKKIPVITAYNINIKDMTILIDRALGHRNYNIKIMSKNATNLGVCTMEDFENLKTLLKNNNVHYYTYTPKSMRPFSIVIEGLSATYSVDDVTECLGSLKIRMNVLGLSKLGGDKWLLRLSRDSDIKAFYGVRYILRCRVNLRKFRKGAVTQCFNCQRFGHVASNCAMPYRCVKCSASHGPGKCAIPAKEDNTLETLITDPLSGQVTRRIGVPVKCVNCNKEGHVASSKDCPRRLELVKKMQTKKTSQAPPVRHHNYASSNVRSGVSYASAAATPLFTSSPKKPTELSLSPAGPSLKDATAEFENINNDCKRFFGDGLLNCLRKIGGFAREYRALKDDESKSRALLGMLTILQCDG